MASSHYMVVYKMFWTNSLVPRQCERSEMGCSSSVGCSCKLRGWALDGVRCYVSVDKWLQIALNKFIYSMTMCEMGCSSSVGRSVGIRGIWMASDAMVAYINDCVFMAILRDTNSLWWRLTRQFLPWAFSVARLSHCAMGSKPFRSCSLIFIPKYGRLWWQFYSTFVWSINGMTCSWPFCMTQILFEEGLRGSFCLEPFWWLGAATVQWGRSLFEVAALSSFPNVAVSGGHFTPPLYGV